jgi:hypothetical protein
MLPASELGHGHIFFRAASFREQHGLGLKDGLKADSALHVGTM